MTEHTTGATRALEAAGITLVYVPAGGFNMGSSARDSEAYDSEKPAHAVYLDGYWIGQTEVTNAQYRRFMEAGGYSKRECWTEEGWQWKEADGITQPKYWDDERFNGPQQPVLGVSWYEATAFAKWAGGRLPTEAEWEYAARGGPLSKGYRYAGSDDADEVAWHKETSGGCTHPVGQKRPNELGLYDMSGNAGEWCADWYDRAYYSRSARDNPQGPESGEFRVLRGGSWYLGCRYVRCTDRLRLVPYPRNGSSGFRVAVAS
jgi:formylglycine-generating enzyme required for sulfatase activity